jgi:transcriptional regulator with AAA-type ATPase domain
MLEMFKTIGRVAPMCEPGLIVGESGTGKELVAPELLVDEHAIPVSLSYSMPRREAACTFG